MFLFGFLIINISGLAIKLDNNKEYCFKLTGVVAKDYLITYMSKGKDESKVKMTVRLIISDYD